MFRHSPTSDRRQPGLHRLCQQAAIHQAFSTSSSPRRSVCKERCCSCPRQGAQPAHAGLSQESSTLQHSSAAQICSDSDRKSTRLNSSHLVISYAVFCLKKKNNKNTSIDI